MTGPLSRRSWGGTRDKPKNVCVGGYKSRYQRRNRRAPYAGSNYLSFNFSALDKLLRIDVQRQINKTSNALEINFVIVLILIRDSTHGKLVSYWRRKEDFRYSVSRFGDWIIKARKITRFLTKIKQNKTKQNETKQTKTVFYTDIVVLDQCYAYNIRLRACLWIFLWIRRDGMRLM